MHPDVYAMVVPGSNAIKRQAESEGLDAIFKDAGLDWREAGCSMCLGMNPDILEPGQRCASTSNRNFENRQGKGGRTHLVSPEMAAASSYRGPLRGYAGVEVDGRTEFEGWNMSTLSGTALGDYGHSVFERDGFVCVYCGFDGNGFHQWRQLSVDHLRPTGAGGTNSPDNLVTACNFCNSATSRMKFSPDQSTDEILTLKKNHVADRLKSFYKFWSDEVAPRDVALTPEQGGVYLPNPLVLDLRAIGITDEQLIRISSDNGDLRLELTSKGELVVMPPAVSLTGWQEGELYFQLTLWARQDGTGMTFGPSAGFQAAQRGRSRSRRFMDTAGNVGRH